MKRWMLVVVAAAVVLLAAAWWHWPAVAQRSPDRPRRRRDDHLRAIPRLPHSRSAAAPSAARAAAGRARSCRRREKASLERRKAYYDQLAAMPAEERDQLYRERFDQIDANHDGELDPEERAAWREKQREHYRQQSAERAALGRAGNSMRRFGRRSTLTRLAVTVGTLSRAAARSRRGAQPPANAPPAPRGRRGAIAATAASVR